MGNPLKKPRACRFSFSNMVKLLDLIRFRFRQPWDIGDFLSHRGTHQGLVTVPFWEDWTSPEKVAIIDYIPNGGVMFNGDI